MNFPPVTILIGTYNRLPEIQATMEALVDLLTYPADRIHVLVADNHSPDGYLTKLKKLKVFKTWETRFTTTPATVSWGEKINAAMATITDDYTVYVEDDYILKQPLDLRVGVALLVTRPNVGLLRYGGTAGDHVVFHQVESDVSGILPDWRENMGGMGRLTYLHFDSGSPTAYLYSHRPHLKHRRFHAYYGAYAEGRKLGDTEEEFAIRVKGMQQRDHSAPGIAILPDWVCMKWDHVGISYQHTEHDRA